MKRSLLFLALSCVLLNGCVSTSYESDLSMIPIVEPFQKEFIDTSGLYLGMTQTEAADILGTEVNVGYTRSEEMVGVYDPIVVQNPYRSEIIRDGEIKYDVFYYFHGIKKADGIIAEDELYPLIFEDNRLIGRGWDYLYELKGDNI